MWGKKSQNIRMLNNNEICRCIIDTTSDVQAKSYLHWIISMGETCTQCKCVFCSDFSILARGQIYDIWT